MGGNYLHLERVIMKISFHWKVIMAVSLLFNPNEEMPSFSFLRIVLENSTQEQSTKVCQQSMRNGLQGYGNIKDEFLFLLDFQNQPFVIISIEIFSSIPNSL